VRADAQTLPSTSYKIPKLKHYDGKNIDEAELFIKRFKRFATLNKWDEKEQLVQFPCHLESKAATAYENMSESDQNNYEFFSPNF